ncbi:hypothetical protein [Allisonella histaminiformans]|uniref:hypothetical protein n=1 Tax=Allisonella histaminiformans TaxID=209880 RepID=UPI002E78F3E8|nr:hypothetical protein [Allisonella histaminiformans]
MITAERTLKYMKNEMTLKESHEYREERLNRFVELSRKFSEEESKSERVLIQKQINALAVRMAREDNIRRQFRKARR